MKKSLIILGNILIILAVLAAVFLDVSSEQQWRMETKREDFENMTAAMESVTANYLLGEQQVCNAWARYINASDLTAEEAISFLGKSVNRPQVMAHILYEENGELVGLSTEAHKKDPGDYTVSYKNIDILEEEYGMLMSEDSVVKVTRAYTNPVNAIQSIAFCCNVKIRDEETGENKDAVILRIIPISAFEQRWAFPTEDYQDAVISLIDADGDYIIRGKSFKNSNFYEFYQSYNTFTAASVNELRAVVGGEPGSVEMINSQDQECLIGHTRVNYTDNWIIVTMIPMRELKEHESNWTLIGIIVAGLLLLLIFNLHSVMNLNRQLKAAAVAADQANRAKTDFLSTMSHDIRTPMNAIIGLTTIAGKNTEDQVTVKESLRKINLASNHLLTLINDILDISKVESGKLNLSPVTFSIVECAENLVNISQPMVKEKNIDFNFRVSHFKHEYLYADQLRINQIFINILSNAVKYTEPGGTVDVDIREEKGETDKTVKITYVVADTGIGMTPEYMQHMYDPFTRQTDSRVNTIQGTGLGLSITKKMIDLMNGTIDCESEVGKGTTFTVKLEIAVADKTEEEMKLPPVNVLIADDDDVLRQTAADTLRSIGVEADTAAGGMEAVQKVQDGAQYQVVLLDLKMPDMDGIETARKIREKMGDKVPIVLISAYDWSDMEEAAKEAGVNGFISKPLFRSTLYNKLSEVLGNERENNGTEDENADIAGMHILVTEDNDINWEIISMLLQMQGVETERAVNGLEAVERMKNARKGEFDLIFMDIQMPVMNGIEATKQIRALEDPWARQIPIIAMTADAFSENVAECFEAGMNGHIAKPIDMKIVLKEIRRIKEENRA
ncbi:response regulator [Aristaeella hokkaidonensis]|uniref:Response regulator n=1 Tax=Aristaeella hokkaidonensis TaxID=3046382 RepID=A0AC61MYM0_9FIRM|nr:response regulator [Aristaeella hokkaidonensis]QUC68192.1 response regulator [Aristaeella hokkaidonensis]SNT95249.1 Signal transduction histidine kinase [Aristaeella hokkaidonensis]